MHKKFKSVLHVQRYKYRALELILIVALVGGIGVYLFGASHAATPYASNEAESGTLANGSTPETDTTASGGKYVQFGAAIANSDPLSGDSFYVATGSDNYALQAESGQSTATVAALTKIANQPTAHWIDDNSSNDEPLVNQLETAAISAGQVPVFVLYEIPGRDCGSYSSGGYATDALYQAYVDQIKAGIDGRKAVVIIEPDGLPLLHTCTTMTAAQITDRENLISWTAQTLQAAGITEYLDAGNAYFVAASYMISILNASGIQYTQGFSLNVSNFDSTASEESFGAQISAGVGNKHFVIDTSRDGNGPIDDGTAWCNPAGAALGKDPTASTGDSLVDAFLWVKYPGASDGQCMGDGVSDPSAPVSGLFWTAYAVGLANGDSP
jgi:endoglucanase